MKKLIITADDYGMSLAVNRAIDAGIDAGLITSTNVMCNMPYFNEAIKLKSYDSVSIGIHFTLSCGFPVSNAEDIPTLVSSTGEFYKYAEFRERYRKHLISNADILTELTAQYDRFVGLLGAPDYWNTHQNVHVDFGIYRLFVDFACEHNINKMRSHQRIYVPGSTKEHKRSFVWRILEPIKSRMLNAWQKNAHKKGIASPDGLICCLNKSDINSPEYLFSHIDWRKATIGEYVIHPAIENDSPYFGKIVEQRIREFETFTSELTKQIIKEAGIELTHY